MNDHDLIRAAHNLRVVAVPGGGFLFDGEPAAANMAGNLDRLIKDEVLLVSGGNGERPYVAPTTAGLTVLRGPR